MSKSYPNAAAFRQALEARLRSAARARGVQIQGLRLKVAIERLLARLFRQENPPWLLKGGYALELRFRPKARTTRDVDLTIAGRVEPGELPDRLIEVHEALDRAAKEELGDFFQFTIPPAKSELGAAPGGVFSVLAKVGGREFARFHIDVGFGDRVVGEVEMLAGEDLMAFAGVAPARALAIPKAQQFAEKIHAYTYPWTDRENTRSRDLVDLILLIERGALDPDEVRLAILETFRHRKRQQPPDCLQAPPAAWKAEFSAMATAVGISTPDLDQAFLALSKYWERLGPLDPCDSESR